jgi:hypothetical protein
MEHPIHRVTSFERVAPYTLKVTFEDKSQQVIDFRPILEGDLYGQLQDQKLFEQVEVDPEVHTLVWPNGADFDPSTLHDWPEYGEKMKSLAKQWASQQSQVP